MDSIQLTKEYYKILNEAILEMQPYTKDQIIYLYAQFLAENHIDNLLYAEELNKEIKRIDENMNLAKEISKRTEELLH